MSVLLLAAPGESLPSKLSVNNELIYFISQPHTNLNRFAKVDDRKTELFLTVLSYVDFYKPSYLYFENVPDFARTKIIAPDDGEGFAIEGGVFKLFVHALLTMGSVLFHSHATPL